jgi:hypothetical protein
MAETTTTTFRFPVEFHDLIGRMAKATSTSRTDAIQKSVLFTAGLLNEASRASYTDLDHLRRVHGNDARIVMAAVLENGRPVGKMLINGKDVDDVRCVVSVDEQAGEAHLFLDVARHSTPSDHFIKVGDEALFVSNPRMPVGTLPWPPKPNLAIQIELADIEQAAKEAEQAAEDLIEIR